MHLGIKQKHDILYYKELKYKNKAYNMMPCLTQHNVV